MKQCNQKHYEFLHFEKTTVTSFIDGHTFCLKVDKNVWHMYPKIAHPLPWLFLTVLNSSP